MLPILEIAERLGVPARYLHSYGPSMAKVHLDLLGELPPQRGKLVLVTAITPTIHGEGKTVTTIGLAQALTKIGQRAVATVRQPSLGPVFGQKGGATGGGLSQVLPHDRINVHFTGDFHAVAAAQNTLAALIDASIYHGNPLDLDPQSIDWPRALDVNDRSLREVITGLGGRINGAPRESGFVITAASEIMAILGLASSLDDLRRRLGNIVFGATRQGRFVRADELGITGSLLMLMADAIHPNLAQTTEGTPALVHSGPFANIAHGTASVASLKMAMGLADYVVNETGFAADLGAEKFFDIVMPASGIRPHVAVVVASVRAVAAQSGSPDVTLENLQTGIANLTRHVENTRKFGVPVIVAINRFPKDDPAHLAWLADYCRNTLGAPCAISDVYGQGGEGGRELAELVVASGGGDAQPLYEPTLPLADKIRRVATTIYRAGEVNISASAARKLRKIEGDGFGHLPVCIAKTQYSFSDNAKLINAPSGFEFTVSDAYLRAGAGFVTAVAGSMSLMPGLGKTPAALHLDVAPNGAMIGLDG
jgi:formate--tetrahydrofolate ligase